MTNAPQITYIPPQISIVSPIYGCKGCLEELIDRIGAALKPYNQSYEIILIDDASPDNAWEKIVELSHHHPHVHGLRLSRNFGQHAAISAGLKQAKGNVIIVMDCDLQDIPEEIPNLLNALDKNTEIAIAQRIQRQDSFTKKLGSKIFYKILAWLTESNYDHTTANFGAYKREVIDTINAMPEIDRFFPLMVQWTGFRKKLIPVAHGKRETGSSGYSFKKLIMLALKVTLAFSDKPLRLVVKAGMLFATFALVFTAFSIYRYIDGDINVAGFTSIIASIWLVGGFTISCIGVLGLYISQIYNQSKGRPQFVIAETTQSEI